MQTLCYSFPKGRKKLPFHCADILVIAQDGNHLSVSTAGMEEEHEV